MKICIYLVKPVIASVSEAIPCLLYKIASSLALLAMTAWKVYSSGILLVLIFLVLVCQSAAYAGLSVDPVAAEIIAVPGKEIAQIFKLKNTGKETIQVRIEATPIDKQDDPGKWLIIKQAEFKIEPEAEYDFSCFINPSLDLGAESKARLFFTADEIDEKGNLKSFLGLRIGVSVYAVILEKTVLDAQIETGEFSYNTEKKLFSGKIAVKNNSNIHIRPIIDVIILDNNRNEVFRFRAPYGQGVPKEQTRNFKIENNFELANGEYKALVNMDYGSLYGIKGKAVNKEIVFSAGATAENKVLTEEKKNEEAQK